MSEPVARVFVHKTGGNVGIRWSGVPVDGAPLMHDGELLYTADAIREAVLDERDALARDAARFDWYFGKTDKIDFMQTYLTGMKDGWTPAQWRAAIDAAMKGASDES